MNWVVVLKEKKTSVPRKRNTPSLRQPHPTCTTKHMNCCANDYWSNYESSSCFDDSDVWIRWQYESIYQNHRSCFNLSNQLILWCPEGSLLSLSLFSIKFLTIICSPAKNFSILLVEKYTKPNALCHLARGILSIWLALCHLGWK